MLDDHQKIAVIAARFGEIKMPECLSFGREEAEKGAWIVQAMMAGDLVIVFRGQDREDPFVRIRLINSAGTIEFFV